MNDARRKFLQTAGLSAACAAVPRGAFAEKGGMGSKPTTGTRCPEKPKAIISGESQTDRMAKFAHRVTYEDLAPERRERLKVSILDSLACAINALGASPTAACLAQAKEFGGPNGRCTLIGGGRTSPDQAAFFNSSLVRMWTFSIATWHRVAFAIRVTTSGPSLQRPNT